MMLLAAGPTPRSLSTSSTHSPRAMPNAPVASTDTESSQKKSR